MSNNWITFGKDRYHQNRAMEQWCEKNIGPGCWAFGKANTWQGMDDKLWTIDSMFGNTTFSFKNDKDCTLFLLRWA